MFVNRIERARASEERSKELMTFDEALEFFRVSQPTLLKALKAGEIAGFKIGRQWRVSRIPPKAGVENRTSGVDN